MQWFTKVQSVYLASCIERFIHRRLHTATESRGYLDQLRKL